MRSERVAVDEVLQMKSSPHMVSQNLLRKHAQQCHMRQPIFKYDDRCVGQMRPGRRPNCHTVKSLMRHVQQCHGRQIIHMQEYRCVCQMRFFCVCIFHKPGRLDKWIAHTRVFRSSLISERHHCVFQMRFDCVCIFLISRGGSIYDFHKPVRFGKCVSPKK